MQIDFHHATTYVLARSAGFEHPEANIIAYASQYVDDATSAGTVYFNNQAVYNRISSAHKMLDCRNSQELANHQVWLAFHFLPGNGGKEADENWDGDGSFIRKIVCRPNSPIAQDMIRGVIREKNTLYGLQRLGVAMHIYADTWAHQGFAGVLNDINEVEDAEETGHSGVFGKKLGSWLRDKLDDVIPPLGHGRANIFPDMPFLQWQYYNGKGEKVERDNTRAFMEAAEQMCCAMQRYIAGDADANVPGLDPGTKSKIHELFVSETDKEGEKRHAGWLKAIRSGAFSFGAADLEYTPRGRHSWKAQALGTSHDLPVHKYSNAFLHSNWKLFHDAIQAHRFHIVHDILPRYDICAA